MNKIFTCRRCGYNTTYKQTLQNHLIKKTECCILLEDITREKLLEDLTTKEVKKHICSKCNQVLGTRQSKYRHQLNCTKYKDEAKIKNLEDISKKYYLEKEYSKQLVSVENNTKDNVITSIDERLFILMKEELNTDEQQQFVNSFKLYLKYGYDDTAFVIDFDNVWKWVGFSQKVNAKRLLISKFEKDIHYQDHSSQRKSGIIGSEKEIILLTVNAFKKFCMKASTKRAEDICNYYIKMEKIMFQYTNEKLAETQSKLNKFIEYDEELFWNDNQINDYDTKNVIYIGFIGIINNERIYKFGKSEQIYTREFKQHQKFFNTFKMKYVIESDNMSFVEKEFKKNLKSRNLLKNIEIKNYNLTELFTITEHYNIDFIIENLKKIVLDYPLPSIKNLQDIIKEKDEEICKYKNKIEELELINSKIN